MQLVVSRLAPPPVPLVTCCSWRCPVLLHHQSPWYPVAVGGVPSCPSRFQCGPISRWCNCPSCGLFQFLLTGLSTGPLGSPTPSWGARAASPVPWVALLQAGLCCSPGLPVSPMDDLSLSCLALPGPSGGPPCNSAIRNASPPWGLCRPHTLERCHLHSFTRITGRTHFRVLTKLCPVLPPRRMFLSGMPIIFAPPPCLLL